MKNDSGSKGMISAKIKLLSTPSINLINSSFLKNSHHILLKNK